MPVCCFWVEVSRRRRERPGASAAPHRSPEQHCQQLMTQPITLCCIPPSPHTFQLPAPAPSHSSQSLTLQELDELSAARLTVHQALLQLTNLCQAAAVDGVFELTV